MNPEDPEIQKLIALKRYEKPPEDYFDHFLSEFQCRQREELLKRSSLSILAERVATFFKEFGASKWLLGAGAAYAVIALSFIIFPKNQEQEIISPQLVPVSYQPHAVTPIPEVDFENRKRYLSGSERLSLRHEF